MEGFKTSMYSLHDKRMSKQITDRMCPKCENSTNCHTLFTHASVLALLTSARQLFKQISENGISV